MSLRTIDCHVHLVGDGSSGSGCWFELPTLWKRFLAKQMIKGLGLPMSVLESEMDERYAENLVMQIELSDLDAAVVLAQDLAYDREGRPLDGAQFYIPNEWVAALAKKYPEQVIPACSIHPGRSDAMDELERCIDAGMPVMKLLPNCLNIDYDDDRYLPFWQRVADAGMILLSHTGGEMTVKVYDPSFGDPKKLATVLDCGVTVIAAHAAGRSGLFDPDWTEDLIAMFGRYPHLYTDNSALCTPNRARTLKHLFSEDVQSRVIHGSDYPVPVSGFGPWMVGKLGWSQYRALSQEKNILQHDLMLKREMGFDAGVFTRMDALLQRG
ncbi:amidohydrolase family protein [Verrucomicrobiaceae bacterium N1E253]|uniref:Amidohydrolase family protein n=1 Tax=Oceaniferula marina TaxID=2748318 RepID=A0A851GK66_9BACT|nr:amidohydrolase family protein [Oceaniferula marina]NWK55565.1 amidohydrolase family protein [Oceaniferula marina]